MMGSMTKVCYAHEQGAQPGSRPHGHPIGLHSGSCSPPGWPESRKARTTKNYFKNNFANATGDGASVKACVRGDRECQRRAMVACLRNDRPNALTGVAPVAPFPDRETRRQGDKEIGRQGDKEIGRWEDRVVGCWGVDTKKGWPRPMDETSLGVSRCAGRDGARRGLACRA